MRDLCYNLGCRLCSIIRGFRLCLRYPFFCLYCGYFLSTKKIPSYHVERGGAQDSEIFGCCRERDLRMYLQGEIRLQEKSVIGPTRKVSDQGRCSYFMPWKSEM